MRDILKLFVILPRPMKMRCIFLLFVMTMTACLETLGVSSIAPFMEVITAPQELTEFEFFGFSLNIDISETSFSIAEFAGFVCFALIFLGSVLALLNQFLITTVSNYLGAEISSLMFRGHLYKKWEELTLLNKSFFSVQILTEPYRVTNNIVFALFFLYTKGLLAILIILLLIYLSPFAAAWIVLLMGVFYSVLYLSLRSVLSVEGLKYSKNQRSRYKLLDNVFTGVREIILGELRHRFAHSYLKVSHKIAKSQNIMVLAGALPRYLIELMGLGMGIFLILFLFNQNNGDISKVMPYIAVFGFSAYKLLPCLHQIYVSLVEIRGAKPGFDAIKKDLFKEISLYHSQTKLENPIFFDELDEFSFEIRDCSFKYTSSSAPILSRINFRFGNGEKIAFVGISGSGKSTFLDLISGLLKPASGENVILRDGSERVSTSAWMRNLTYLSQKAFVFENSILNNVTLGSDNILDEAKIRQALRLSNSENFVDSLPAKLGSVIGENGVQFSGGQIQRLGFARLFYLNKRVLLLDEATAALDGDNEKIILENLFEKHADDAVIMATHDLRLLKYVKRVVYLENGEIIFDGSVDSFLKTKIYQKVGVS